MKWKLIFTKQAQKDAKRIRTSGLKDNVQKLLAIIEENPYQSPPPFEKLVGDLSGAYSRRINIQHRLVYQVMEDIHGVKVIRLWTHYRAPLKIYCATNLQQSAVLAISPIYMICLDFCAPCALHLGRS